jgi:hypothetical protein
MLDLDMCLLVRFRRDQEVRQRHAYEGLDSSELVGTGGLSVGSDGIAQAAAEFCDDTARAPAVARAGKPRIKAGEHVAEQRVGMVGGKQPTHGCGAAGASFRAALADLAPPLVDSVQQPVRLTP